MADFGIALPAKYDAIPASQANAPNSRRQKAPAVSALILEVISKLRNVREAERAPWAEWPRALAFDEAVKFVRAWKREPEHMPNVGVAHDGEVNFLWKDGGVHVDIGFYADGTYSYYARDRQGCPYERDDVSPDDGLTEELLGILARRS